MYWIARQLGARKDVAAFLILALVSSRTFLFASHSARYDIWVGLGILIAWYAAIRFIQSKDRLRPISWFLFGLSLPCLLVWNIHVLRMAGILWLFAFVAANGWSSVRSFGWTAFGAIAG